MVQQNRGQPRAETGIAAFEEWLLDTIGKSPLVRTHSKAQILEIAVKEFKLAPYTAEITRSRVIAMLGDRQASRVWHSHGVSSADNSV